MYTIRTAKLDDVEILVMVRHKAIVVLAAEQMGENEALSWANSATNDRVQQAVEKHHVYVVEVNGKPVAWIEYDQNRIEGLYVNPKQAQQGIGSMLLCYVEARLRDEGHSKVILNASWNAEQFYIRRGYCPQAERSVELGRPMVKYLAKTTKS
ncbi:MAG: GNAT family N-acetyltransferase [Chloroflexota bacterium]